MSNFRPTRRVRTFLSHLMGSVLLLMPALAAAEPTYTLKLDVGNGAKWTFDVRSDLKQKGRVTANGQVVKQIEQSLGQRRKGTIEVLSVDGTKLNSVRVTYDPESANSGNSAGEEAPPFHLGGKTVTVTRGEDGAITTDLPDAPDAQTMQELNKLLEPDTSFYPHQAVAVGDEWDADSAAIARQFQLGADDKAAIKCKLLAIKELDGRQVADVSIAGSISKKEQGFVLTKTTLGGVSRLDLITGQAMALDVIGKLATTGDSQVTGNDGQPVKIDVSADGNLEVHQTVKVSGGSPGVVTDQPKPPGEAPAAAHGLFAGTFKGDELSAQFSGDGAALSGFILLHDKKLPLTAKADGNKVSGSFESDGSKFEFNAVLDGDALSLTSGGTTYILNRPKANPLGRPKAKNPLAP